MARTREWYEKFIQSTFRRGKAVEVPREYIFEQARFMKKEELQELADVFDAMVKQGAIVKNKDMYSLQ